MLSLLSLCSCNVAMQEPSIYQSDTTNGYTAFLSGIIMSAWSLMGYDAAAHMIEETISADKAACWSFLLTAGISFVCGFLYLLGLAICIQVVRSHTLCQLPQGMLTDTMKRRTFQGTLPILWNVPLSGQLPYVKA